MYVCHYCGAHHPAEHTADCPYLFGQYLQEVESALLFDLLAGLFGPGPEPDPEPLEFPDALEASTRDRHRPALTQGETHP